MSDLEKTLKDAFKPAETREVLISRMYKKGKILVNEEAEEERIPVKVPPEYVPLANVTYGGKFTKNLLDFNSVTINIQVTLPCTLEEIGGAYDAAKAFVEKRSHAEFEAVKERFPKAFKVQ